MTKVWQLCCRSGTNVVIGTLLLAVTIPEPSSWQLKRDRLVALQRQQFFTVGLIQNTNHFFYINKESTGLEYDLIQQLGNFLSLQPKIVVFSTAEEMDFALRNDTIDFTTSIKEPRTSTRLAEYSHSRSYLDNKLLLVQRNPKQRITLTTINSLDARVLTPIKYRPLLQAVDLSAYTNKPIHWLYSTENYNYIFSALAEQHADATVLDQFELAIYQLLYPDIIVTDTLPKKASYRFTLKQPGNQRLQHQINIFINDMKKNGLLRQLYRRYYAYNQISNKHNANAFLQAIKTQYPKLRDTFIQAAKRFNFDPLLLAAIAYQESKWDPKAVSPTGVKGMMMLTHATAEEVGVTDRLNVLQSINGGTQYLASLLTKIPERILLPDRLWFALASYNIGFGHLEDARRLTQRAGLNPDVWDNVVRYLPRLSQRKWYRQVKFGKARGQEAVVYVRNIRRFYDVLRHVQDDISLPEQSIIHIN